MGPIVHRTKINEQLERLQDAIRRRAYEHHERNTSASDIDNWLAAERELVQRPIIEMREQNEQVELLVGMPGVKPDDVEVHVEPQDVLIRALPREAEEASPVEVSMLGTIHLPEPINPDSVQAEFRDGLLRVTADRADKAPAATRTETVAAR
jgi:HSP20 family molecular chaperone IbpA